MEKVQPSVRASIVRRAIRFEEFGVLSALLMIAVFLALTTEQFMYPNNLLNVARQASYWGIMAVGLVFVISQGDIDISVGAMFNFSTIAMAFALQQGLSHNLVIPFGLLIGLTMGFINGSLMLLLRIPAIIVTLGTMAIYRGLSLVVSNATTIASFPKDNWFFQGMGGRLFDSIPASVVIMVLVGIGGYILYNHSVFGRHVCAVGANRQAAQYAGIKVNQVRLLTMMLSGVICSIAGIAVLSFLGAADPSVGAGSEIMVISAAIIGGASLSGGSGSVLGAVIGALIIAVIRNGLVLLNISIYWQGVVTGATIIAAVALDYVIKRRR
mgnify:CR=1 FL=1